MKMTKLHLVLSIVTGFFHWHWQVDQQPTSSMMMAKHNPGLSMGMAI